MDWIKDFETKFNRYIEVVEIKAKKMHGRLVIDFSDGVPQACQIKRYFKGEKVNVNGDKL